MSRNPCSDCGTLEMENLNSLLQELVQIIQDSKPFLGTRFIDEERFYVCTFRLKKIVPQLFDNPRCQSTELLKQLEMLIEKDGKGRFWGKVTIDTKAYESLFSALLSAVEKEQELIKASPQEPSDEVIRDAKTEAQTIIAEAKREAQRIIDNAKREIS